MESSLLQKTHLNFVSRPSRCDECQRRVSCDILRRHVFVVCSIAYLLWSGWLSGSLAFTLEDISKDCDYSRRTVRVHTMFALVCVLGRLRMKVEKRIRFVPSRAVGVSRQIASGARRERTAGPKHSCKRRLWGSTQLSKGQGQVRSNGALVGRSLGRSLGRAAVAAAAAAAAAEYTALLSHIRTREQVALPLSSYSIATRIWPCR